MYVWNVWGAQMSTQRKVLWALGLPMVGLVLALPFQHRANEGASAEPNADLLDGAHLALMDTTNAGHIDLVIDTMVDQPPQGGDSPGFNEMIDPHRGSLSPQRVVPTQQTLDNAPLPPSVGNQYVPFFRRVSSEPPSDLTQHMSPTNEPERRQIAELERTQRFERAPSIEVLRYTIRDGDTLRGIASKFLGDPNRAGEIFDANRNVLADPQLLPLRTEIVVERPVND